MTDRLIVAENSGRIYYKTNFEANKTGEENQTFSSPLGNNELEELRWYFEDYLTAPYAVWEEKGKEIESALRPIGERLFKHLFDSGELGRSAYREFANSSNSELWLSSTDPNFLGLPWELIQDPSGDRPLALDLSTGINRTLDADQPILEAPSGKHLRVLMVIARPDGINDVRYRAIARPLFEKLKGTAEKVQIELCRPPSLEELERRLGSAQEANRPFQILHFDGHGTFGEDLIGGRQGFLLFEKNGVKEFVSAAKLGALISQFRVPLVVLNACRSGKMGGIGPDAAVAT